MEGKSQQASAACFAFFGSAGNVRTNEVRGDQSYVVTPQCVPNQLGLPYYQRVSYAGDVAWRAKTPPTIVKTIPVLIAYSSLSRK